MTAKQKLLNMFMDSKWHSWEECKDIGGVRYSARIYELKREGHIIDTKPTLSGKGLRYRLSGTGSPQEKRVRVFLSEQEVVNLLSVVGLSSPTRRVLKDALSSYRANKDKL